jgi:hypothetical protein
MRHYKPYITNIDDELKAVQERVHGLKLFINFLITVILFLLLCIGLMVPLIK